MVTNDPKRKGQIAVPKERFGEFGRYAVYAVHTRFDAVQWFVDDAHQVDEVTGGPVTIRQGATRDEVMAGFPVKE